MFGRVLSTAVCLALLTACNAQFKTGSGQQYGAAACGITDAKHKRFMALSQKDFDQDVDGGWRAIADKDGCKNAAAELIKDYILYSEPYQSEDIGSLRWHAGQMKAYAGKSEEAVKLFRGTYDRADHSPDWNFYVDATIGFLEGDKASLERAYEGLSAYVPPPEKVAARRKFMNSNPDTNFPPGFAEQPPNIKVVKSLLDCFGESYERAYGGCKPVESE